MRMRDPRRLRQPHPLARRSTGKGKLLPHPFVDLFCSMPTGCPCRGSCSDSTWEVEIGAGGGIRGKAAQLSPAIAVSAWRRLAYPVRSAVIIHGNGGGAGPENGRACASAARVDASENGAR